MLDIFHHKTLYCAWPFIEDILESIWWIVDGKNENFRDIMNYFNVKN
jgi:hypothetical protein